MKTRLGKIRALLATAALTLTLGGMLYAQDPTPGILPPTPSERSLPKPKVKPPNKKIAPVTRAWTSPPDSAPPAMNDAVGANHFGGDNYERSIAVDPRINVSLCVTQGDVKINGWSRNEVRVFVKDGSKIGFSVLQKSRQNEMPVWVKVVGFQETKPGAGVAKECIWGDEVEIDVPISAAVNLEGRETSTTIDSVRKASVKNAGGNITIRNVTEGVNALTYEGDVDVENSDGQIVLTTTTGNIVAFELGPGQVGDTFRAKTNSGNISLQGLQHLQVDVNSISGSLMYSGALLNNGIYSMGTSNGTLSLGIPPNSPCFLIATYIEGNFNSEVPFKLATENVQDEMPGPLKTIKGTLGQGNCKVNLTNNSGAIRLRKQQ